MNTTTHEIDIRSLNDATPVFLVEVIRFGRLVYARSRREQIDFLADSSVKIGTKASNSSTVKLVLLRNRRALFFKVAHVIMPPVYTISDKV